MSTGNVVSKTCNTQNYCSYKYLGTCGNGCNYYGYCDYQTPRDSRNVYQFNYLPEEKGELNV
jgi:hypothetical protein